MTNPGSLQRTLAVAILAALGLAACSSAASPPASALPGQTGTVSPVPASTPPVASTDPAASSVGGGSASDPGTGGRSALPQDPIPVDPIAGQARIVQPVPGRLNPHPVAPVGFEASIDGRHVRIKVTWYGGVEPCSVLDSVQVTRSGNDITITPIEGASDPNAICIEIAVLKATIVDLGEADPGTYRILSPGSDAPPIQITID